MASTRLSTKGQVVLPREIRESLNWTAGKALDIEKKGDTVVLKPRKKLPEKSLKPEDIVGFLQWHGEPFTIREMDEAVSEMFRREWK
jgi:AbrB family looped-hinge helix DNA binding protein